jgi:hypothetical protein
MANNFKNAVVYNVSADETLPSIIYTTPTSKKAIAIEIDVSNNSSAGVTVTTLLEDESKGAATDQVISTVTGINSATNTVFTTSGVHGLTVNDRIRFNQSAGTAPGGLTGGAEGTGKIYYVASVDSTTTFKAGVSRGATTYIQCSSAGSSPTVRKLYIATVVRNAPVPVGGTLKVISGQKLVLESTSATVHDKILAWCSSANNVDCIASVLEDVS